MATFETEERERRDEERKLDAERKEWRAKHGPKGRVIEEL